MKHLDRRALLGLGFAGLIGAPLLLAGSRRAQAANHAVEIRRFKFTPKTLRVSVGDTVTFTNRDGAAHTATGSSFDTGTLRRDHSATVTIAEAGTLPYRCRFHPRMKGAIIAG